MSAGNITDRTRALNSLEGFQAARQGQPGTGKERSTADHLGIYDSSHHSHDHLTQVKEADALEQQIQSVLPYLTEAEMNELDLLLDSWTPPPWTPLPGPQTMALESDADIIFYGGAAGGGKTDLLLGAALCRHRRSIIFRREFAQLKGVRERAEEIYGALGSFNGQLELWRLKKPPYSDVRVEFGACQWAGDEKKYQGRPHDLKAFDEITHFTEAQFRFLITWNRTTTVGQRARVICAGNPPTDAEGDWVIKFWAPWLDPRHPNSARPGELRWFVTDPQTGEDLEVPSGRPLYLLNDDGEQELVQPKSRTFIFARVEDNPHLMSSGYKSVLQALPEPLRSRMLKGNFNVGAEDAEWQVIPTAWILAAQMRWEPSYAAFLARTHHTNHPSAGGDLHAVQGSADPEVQQHADAQDGISPPAGRGSLDRGSAGTEDFRGKVSGHSDAEGKTPRGNLAGSVSPKGQTLTETAATIQALRDASFTPQTAQASPGTGFDLSKDMSDDEVARLPVELQVEYYERRLGGSGGIGINGRSGVDLATILGDDPIAKDVNTSNEIGARTAVIGVDVSRGGKDKAVFTERRGRWFDKQTVVPGKQVPDGNAIIQTLINLGHQKKRIQIDVVGVGSSPVDLGRLYEMEIIAMNGAESSVARDRSGKLGFANLRAEYAWKLREALDPELGDNLALPPDPELVSDLSSLRWALSRRGIQVEDKAAIKKRLMRSTDKGDSLINAHAIPHQVGGAYLDYYADQVEEAVAAIEAAGGDKLTIEQRQQVHNA